MTQMGKAPAPGSILVLVRRDGPALEDGTLGLLHKTENRFRGDMIAQGTWLEELGPGTEPSLADIRL